MSIHYASPGPGQGERAAFERVMGSRRGWRRLAKRAVAAHERELARLVREVAASRPPVLAATSQPLRGHARAAVVTLSLSLPGWELQLSGVAAGAVTALAELTELTELTEPPAGYRLTRTGRYGAFWWIEVDSPGTGDASTVLLGSQLRLFPTGDGSAGPVPQTPELDLPVSR